MFRFWNNVCCCRMPLSLFSALIEIKLFKQQNLRKLFYQWHCWSAVVDLGQLRNVLTIRHVVSLESAEMFMFYCLYDCNVTLAQVAEQQTSSSAGSICRSSLAYTGKVQAAHFSSVGLSLQCSLKCNMEF